MPFKLTEKQHKELDRYLALVLDAYKDGAFSRSEAIGELAHVMTAAALDNNSELMARFGMSLDELRGGT